MIRGSRTDRGSHHEATPGLTTRAVDLFLRRLRKMPPPRNAYVVERGLRTPTRDGFVLLSDHYAPVVSGSGSGTVLIRTPYGRGLPLDALWCRPFAARDTVVWLRQQPWFNGKLATLAMSYVSYTQWALLADPPPELRASVMTPGGDPGA
jgi:predicted acyl esterase